MLGSAVKCLTRNQGDLCSRRIYPLRFFVGVSSGKTLQSPSLVPIKPRKDMNNVSSRRDVTEIRLNAALSTIQSKEQPVISRWSVHLPMLSWISFNQYLTKTIFPSHLLLSHVTVVEKMDSGETVMNTVSERIVA